jgi:predicted transcriptional regulator
MQVIMSVRFDAPTARRIGELARQSGRTPSALVREWTHERVAAIASTDAGRKKSAIGEARAAYEAHEAGRDLEALAKDLGGTVERGRHAFPFVRFRRGETPCFLMVKVAPFSSSYVIGPTTCSQSWPLGVLLKFHSYSMPKAGLFGQSSFSMGLQSVCTWAVASPRRAAAAGRRYLDSIVLLGAVCWCASWKCLEGSSLASRDWC